MAFSFYAKNRQASSSAEEGGGGASPSPGWEAQSRSDFAYQDPRPPVPQPGSGGTSSRALPAPARNKKEPRRVTHIPGISKVKGKVQDAWHHQKDEFACQDPRPPVSRYAALVGSRVRTGEDVEHLQKRGIVDNLLGTDDDAAAKFFQQLGDCASLEYEDHSFAAMFADLPVPQPGSGGTSSKALPAPARNKKEPRRVTHIPGISKVKDKVQDAWHHQKDEFACQEPRPPVSRYAALVGSRVRTGEDVEHLQKRGVVDNLLGTDDDAAAKVFQQLGDCASLEYEDHSFAAMFADLNRYYRSSWRGHKAEFLRDHCSSPWAALVLVVAGCAFCFALFKFSTTGFH
ncbi:hypothetical protein SEVIR_1G014800v4 [Setaria viridis]|uniref:Uncharacterized protein n=1 Tax=Setaria viridis TaxID=4556 RepID=A0A4U6W7Y9_SETVI|nr:hypothetical protein SEVIR_1G014800v2 [Setaria viridis]